MTRLTDFLFQNDDSGTPVHWGRADIDGLPFRGAAAPIYTEEEYEQRVREVRDPNCRLFEVTDEAQQREYLSVLRRITNGNAQCLCRTQPQVNAETKQVFVYLEWVDLFMTDLKPVAAAYPGGALPQEPSTHGRGDVPTNSRSLPTGRR